MSTKETPTHVRRYSVMPATEDGVSSVVDARAYDALVQQIEAMQEALEQVQQMFMELGNDDPGWFTRGMAGMRAQHFMWVNKGQNAVRAALQSVKGERP